VKGDDQVCLDIDEQTRYLTIDKDASGSKQYRDRVVDTGETVKFSVNQREIAMTVNREGGLLRPGVVYRLHCRAI